MGHAALLLQSWRRLLFMHWPIPAAALRPLVPPALSIDEFQGTAYVGLVPFAVEAARPVGAPARFGLGFLETNVRTYVHRGGGEPGVFFFSLDAASGLATVGARLAFGLPYFWAAGESRATADGTDYRLRRRSRARPFVHVRYRVGDYVGPAVAGTLDHFLVERYVLHVQRGPTLWSVRVHHQPYPLFEVQVDALDDGLVAAAGIGDASGPPPVVHYASGVDVQIARPRIRRLRARQ